MKIARFLLFIALAMLLVPSISPGVAATTVVIDSFEGGVSKSTLDFSKSLRNDSLSIEIPPGATILTAELTVQGEGGLADASSTLNFTNGVIGQDAWAWWNEGRTIYPLKVVPGNHMWNLAAKPEITAINTSDDVYWKTDTQDPQAGAPPGGAYPIHLFSFIPGAAGAENITVRWEGLGTSAFNRTDTYHAEMWLYNHTDKEWIMVII